MSSLEIVGAIVGGIVTIVGGSFALVRYVVGALVGVLKGHLDRVEVRLGTIGETLSTKLGTIETDVAAVKESTTRTADRVDQLAVDMADLTPPPRTLKSVRDPNGGRGI